MNTLIYDDQVGAYRQVYIVLCIYTNASGWCLRGVMVKSMDCGIVVSEFELQSPYYVHFRIDTLGKSFNSILLQAMG